MDIPTRGTTREKYVVSKKDDDIFACSMAKKSNTIMSNNDDIFACSMGKKSTLIKSEKEKLLNKETA